MLEFSDEKKFTQLLGQNVTTYDDALIYLFFHLYNVGSYHESELQFIFGEPYMNYSNHLRSYDDKKMSDLMMKIWGNFIRYG